MLSLEWNKGRSPLRVLCTGAHSDDIEIGCGGTILSLLQSRADVEVRWVVFSGSPERAREARASAAGFLQNARASQVDVHAFRDGHFPSEFSAVKETFEAIKKSFSPDLIFTHYRDDRHQDHRVISDLAWNTFRDHVILEYEIPKYDGDMGQPNMFTPIDAETCEKKIALLLEHFASQRGRQWFDADTFKALLRIRGLEANSPSRFAEAFYARKFAVTMGP